MIDRKGRAINSESLDPGLFHTRKSEDEDGEEPERNRVSRIDTEYWWGLIPVAPLNQVPSIRYRVL